MAIGRVGGSDGSDSFTDTPMPIEFNKAPAGYKGTGAGKYDSNYCPIFDEYRRTPSPNAVPEKFFDMNVPNPSGEADQF